MPKEVSELDLQLAFNSLMQLLNQAMYNHFGPDVKFMVKLDVQMGAEKSKQLELRHFQKKLENILNSLPKEYNFE